MRSLTIGLVLLLTTPLAFAFVPSRTEEGGSRLRWVGTDCVMLRVDPRGTGDIEDPGEFQAVQAAAENWMRSTADCSYLQLVLIPQSELRAGSFDQDIDGRNLVFWIESGWMTEYGFSPSSAAITVTTYVNAPGEQDDGVIVDSDIMLNGEDNTFIVIDENNPPSPVGQIVDIENTLTHELGHLMGIDHPCYDPWDPPDPIPADHLGNAVPACPGATDEMVESTMYNYTSPGETKKRSLEPDDILAACWTFPLDAAHGQCLDVGKQALGRTTPGGCDCATGEASTGSLACLFGLLLSLTRIRALQRQQDKGVAVDATAATAGRSGSGPRAPSCARR